MQKLLVPAVTLALISAQAHAGMTQDEKANQCAMFVTPVTVADTEAGPYGRLENTPTYQKITMHRPVNSTLSQEKWNQVQKLQRLYFDAGQKLRDQNIRGDALAEMLITTCFNSLANR